MRREFKVVPLELDVYQNGSLVLPRDPEFFRMVMEFCKEQFESAPALDRLMKVWVAVMEVNGKPDEILGICGFRQAIDIPVWRVKTSQFAKRAQLGMLNRMNDYFVDQGLRGQYALVLFDDSPEAAQWRCDKYAETLEAAGAVKANRWLVEVK